MTVQPAPVYTAGPQRRLRVLVVDDHEVVQWGFRLLLTQKAWVERCLSARSGDEAAALALRFGPQVAVVDLFVGDEDGVDICARMREQSPGTRVLLISGAGRLSPRAARAAGASGFVRKEWPAQEIAEAVHMVGRGMSVFDDVDEPSAGRLSEREREVLASGATNREIAEALHLSPWTIKEYTSALYRKLGVRSRAQCVQRAQRLGLLA
jgi:two-component system response regulator DesR